MKNLRLVAHLVHRPEVFDWLNIEIEMIELNM